MFKNISNSLIFNKISALKFGRMKNFRNYIDANQIVMNKFQPLDQVRSIVASALNRSAKARKNFESFLIETMILILTIYGRVNFLSMARHGAPRTRPVPVGIPSNLLFFGIRDSA